MKILDRLVAGSFLKLFLAFIVGAPLLFVVGDVVENLDRHIDRGIAMDQVALAYLYMLPQFVLWAFPIAALIAAVFTVHGMTTHREIVAAKAGGISFRRLIVPIVLLGAVFTGVAFWLSEMAPRGTRVAGEILEDRTRRIDWRADFVVQSEDGRTLAARRLGVSAGSLESVVMTRLGEEGEPTEYINADAGSYDQEQGWIFRNGYYRLVRPDGTQSTIQFGSLRTPTLTEQPEEMMEEVRDHEEMTYAQLSRQVDIMRRSGGDPRELEVRLNQKLAIPAATFVIVLFGAPLATSAKRGGAAFGVGASLGSTILYIMLLRVSGALGTTGVLDPITAAWLPNGLFLLAGIILLARVRT